MTIRTVRVRFITYFYTYSYTRISCLSILSQLLTDYHRAFLVSRANKTLIAAQWAATSLHVAPATSDAVDLNGHPARIALKACRGSTCVS